MAFGLQRTGRIITAAALLIAIVFASFLTSSATNIKQLGFGVTVAILLRGLTALVIQLRAQLPLRLSQRRDPVLDRPQLLFDERLLAQCGQRTLISLLQTAPDLLEGESQRLALFDEGESLDA